MNDPGPPPKGWGALPGWLERFYRFVVSIRPISTPDTLVRRTSRGTSQSPMSQTSGGGDGGVGSVVINQWVATDDYKSDDLVFCDTITEQDDGTLAGLFQCTADISGSLSNPEPANDSSHWQMVARGHWGKLTMRVGNQQIVFDAGRDTTIPSIQIFKDYTDSTQGSIKLKIADIAAVAGSGHKECSLQQDTFCYADGLKKIVWLRNDPEAV